VFSQALSTKSTAAESIAAVENLKVTVLSTMLADDGIGEWGYAALVEADGHRFLFDAGAYPDTVLRNADVLGIDLSTVEDVVISHNHNDHTGGLLELRRVLMAINPSAMGRLHVSDGIFIPRLKGDGTDDNGLTPLRESYEALGGQIIIHSGPAEIAPGVWFTGPVPRPNAETNWNTEGLRIRTSEGMVTDNVPEDASMVFATKDGLVVLTGCGHAGIVNISTYAQQLIEAKPVVAVIGGLHLFSKSDSIVDWTGDELKRRGVRYLLAGHCTGIEATFRLRQALGLDRHTAPVSSIGSSYTSGQGISAGFIAG